jgi:hypothetical protein
MIRSTVAATVSAGMSWTPWAERTSRIGSTILDSAKPGQIAL